MNASLDTNIILHLYRAGCSDLLFTTFDRVYAHDFIVNVELKKHGSDIWNRFHLDIENERVIVVDKKFLCGIGMHIIFDEYLREEKMLCSPKDMGKVYASVLARTLGLVAEINAVDYVRLFHLVNGTCQFGWNIERKLKIVLKRFLLEPYTNREFEWMESFCTANHTSFRHVMKELLTYVRPLPSEDLTNTLPRT